MMAEPIYIRSIPARAGEPRISPVTWLALPVYPRACGGTEARAHAESYYNGLSPRVRGNR